MYCLGFQRKIVSIQIYIASWTGKIIVYLSELNCYYRCEISFDRTFLSKVFFQILYLLFFTKSIETWKRKFKTHWIKIYRVMYTTTWDRILKKYNKENHGFRNITITWGRGVLRFCRYNFNNFFFQTCMIEKLYFIKNCYKLYLKISCTLYSTHIDVHCKLYLDLELTCLRVWDGISEPNIHEETLDNWETRIKFWTSMLM